MALSPSSFGAVEIPYAKVLARLGYARGKTVVDPATEESIRSEIALAQKLITPRQVIASSPIIARKPEAVALEDLVIASAKIAELLGDCVRAWGFAVTIGPNLEEKRARYLEAKETARALLLDAAGSVAAEELAELTDRQIKDEARREGYAATRRFSPGYGDWSLAGQKDFLAWLGAGQIGIRLTPSFQMQPEKSVTAILGIKTA